MMKKFTYLHLFCSLLLLINKSAAQNAFVYSALARIVVSDNVTAVLPGNISINGLSYISNDGNVYLAGDFTNNGAGLLTGGKGTVYINGNSNLKGTSTNTGFFNLIIRPNGTLSVDTSNFSITGTGTFTNNGTFNCGTGTVVFRAVATLNGSAATTFYNLELRGATTLSKVPLINNKLTLKNGATVITTANSSPNYSNTSTLVYDYGDGNSFTTTKEWYKGGQSLNTAGTGIPQNVQIKSGIITIGSGQTLARSIPGDLLISNGATFTLNTTSGSDLFVGGNWTNNGSFNHSDRTVTFFGSTDQTINGNTTFKDVVQTQSANTNNLIYSAANTTIERNLTVNTGTMSSDPNTTVVFTGAGSLTGTGTKAFNDLQINNTSAVTVANGDVTINHDFLNNGIYDYSGISKTTTFSGYGANQSMSGAGTTTFGSLIVGSSASAIATNVTATNSYTVTGGSLSLNNGSIFKNTNNTATFSNAAVTVSGNGTSNFYDALVNVAFNPGSGLSTFNNTLQINAGGSITSNTPSYGNTSTLIYNTTTSNLPTGFEWNANSVTPGLGAPANVVIQSTNNILLSGDRGLRSNLGIAAANTLSLNDYTLSINGAFTNTGRLIGSAASGLIIGGAAGTAYFVKNIPFSQLKTLNIKNTGSLTLGGSLANGDMMNIVAGSEATGYGTVTANGTLITNDILTLHSDAAGTAIVAPSSGKITGDVTIERFIPARRAWRFLTVPFSSTNQSINQAWQEGKTNTSLDCSGNQYTAAGYGTQITYNGVNGYDLNTTVNPSIKVWANTGWTTPSSTLSPKITDYKAYCLFVRGDRTVCLSYGVGAVPTNTILRSTGVLNEPGINNNDITKSFAILSAGENVFVGNPYASPVDLYAAFSNAANNSSGIVDGKFAVWDPGIGGNYGVGGYVTVSAGVAVPQTDKFPDASAAAQIQSGEGFFVYSKTNNNTGSANFTFRENNKITNQFNVFNFAGNSNAVSRTFAPAAGKLNRNAKVYINLLLPLQDSMLLLDGTAAVFDSAYSAGIDDFDASKKFNFNENVGLRRDGKSLAIETRPLPNGWDTLFVRTWLIKTQNYTLQTSPQYIPPAVKEAWLVDNYLNTKYKLSTTDTTNYNFAANSDTNSYAGRFMIVFRVERSQPSAITNVNSGSDNLKNLYTKSNITVSPNPVTGKEDAMLRFINISKGNYEIEMFNTAGSKILVREIEHAGATNTYPLKINSAWAAGKYNVVVANKQTGEVRTLPLIIAR